jgi:hypothetical protein
MEKRQVVDLAFFGPPERTTCADGLYAVIGRALSIATHYEANLRALVVLLEVSDQRSALIEADKLEETIERLWRQTLNANIQKLMSCTGKSFGNRPANVEEARARDEFAKLISEKLHKARKARNTIAHESTIGIETRLEDDEYRRDLIEMIEEQVQCIADADFFVAGVIEYCNCVELAPSLEEYIHPITDWVCEVED